MNTPLVVYLIGPTNAGKSTLIEEFKKLSRTHTIEVGKLMRAKYPPEHFKGSSNPTHTAAEAWQMYLDGVAAGDKDPECKLIVCDGQPRDVRQCIDILTDKDHRKLFIHLWAPPEVRAARAVARDSSDPAKLELSLKRLHGDIPAIYDVLARLLNEEQTVWSFNTYDSKTYEAALIARLTHLRALQ